MEEIVRELHPDECIYYTKSKIGEMINAKTFIVESSFDLYECLDQVKKSIKSWIKLHPCLSFHIKQINSELYFTQADKNLIDSLSNVFFLKFKGSNSSASNLDDKHWHMLLKNEIQYYYDTETELLWRLIILKLSDKNYAFILNIHHSISDGSNSYAIILELLSLIENELIYGKLPEPDKQRIELSKYEIEYPNDPRKGGKISDFKWTPTDPLKEVVIPDFIKLPRDQYVDDDSIDVENGFFETIDGVVFKYTNDLIKKNNQINTGHLKMIISENDFSKFVNNCKKNQVKLNGAFELIACLAFRKMYDYFSNNKHGKEDIKYNVTLNMRSKLPIKLPNYVMNVWIGIYPGLIEDTLDVNDHDYWSKFWTIAREKSKKLHEYMDGLKSDNLYDLQEIWKFNEMDKLGYRVDDVFSHLTITNLGEQSMSLFDTKGELKIKEYYTSTSFNEKSYFNSILLATCSIQSKSFWTLTYNRNLIKNSAAQKYFDIVKELILKVSSLDY